MANIDVCFILFQNSKLDITIGPYETYEDGIFGCKATFEAFTGVRDGKSTSQVKLLGISVEFFKFGNSKAGLEMINELHLPCEADRDAFFFSLWSFCVDVLAKTGEKTGLTKPR
ncbi:hypothetical protein MKX01_024480 [Papaver californicum]|nr:hypothetical protein MKX01_024480 [Papaver californicum]